MPVDKVTSADGTAIAVERVGVGRPLVLVHGATADRASWRALTPLLRGRRECWLVDRRGRGDSDDAATYDPEREVEDLQAVFAHAGGTVDLFGHSSGAVLALEAARRSPNVGHLVLYEPPMRVDPTPAGAEPPGGRGMLARIETQLATGDRAEAVRAFYRAGPGISDEQLARMEAGRGWSGTLALAHTIPYDIRLVGTFYYERDRVAQVVQPTLLLVGEASPAREHRTAEVLAATLPNARIAPLPGQGHRAMATAPEPLAGELLAFLDGTWAVRPR